jgi:hypothetical protein
MTISSNPYRGFRFPREVIEHAVCIRRRDRSVDVIALSPIGVRVGPEIPGSP